MSDREKTIHTPNAQKKITITSGIPSIKYIFFIYRAVTLLYYLRKKSSIAAKNIVIKISCR
jgi:hypothetical protein